jgi:hypothetical protein
VLASTFAYLLLRWDSNIAETQLYDFRDFSFIDFIRENGIKAICLYEAHHLRREWQKALEGFIRQIEHEVTIIALTATPKAFASSPNAGASPSSP